MQFESGKNSFRKKILEIRKIKKSYLAQNNYNETEKDFELNQEQITAIAEIEKGIDSEEMITALICCFWNNRQPTEKPKCI